MLLGATGLVGRHVLSQALATSSVTSVTAPARRALQVARLAHRHGTSTFVLNSAMGADRGSRFFYNRVKGEVEHDLADVGFASLRARGDARRAGGGVGSIDVARVSARASRGHTCCLHATNQPGARTS